MTHVTSTWTLRIAFRSRCFGILVTLESPMLLGIIQSQAQTARVKRDVRQARCPLKFALQQTHQKICSKKKNVKKRAFPITVNNGNVG